MRIRDNTSIQSSFLETILLLVGLLMCLLTVFREGYLLFNIAVVVLMIVYFLIANHVTFKLSDIIVFALAVSMVGISLDVARISIFVFHVFATSRAIYNTSTMNKIFTVMTVCLAVTIGSYFWFDFHIEFDRMLWDFTLQQVIPQKSLGFTNPNRCMLFFFCLSCMLFMLTSKIKWYLVIAVLNFVLYQYTQSRTFYYALMFVVAALIILKITKLESKSIFSGKLLIVVFLIGLFLSIVLALYFSDTYLNVLFTNRLAHNKEFLETGITLFGNAELEDAVFDNSYLHMLLTKGVVYFSIYSFVLFSALWKSKVNAKSFCIIATIFIVSYMEVIFLEYAIMLLIGFGLNGKFALEE